MTKRTSDVPQEIKADMDSDEIRHLQDLQMEHGQRLHVLELQAATYGLACPPHITIEIETLRKQIAAIDQQIELLNTPATVIHVAGEGWMLKDRSLATEHIQQVIDEVLVLIPQDSPELAATETFGPMLLRQLLKNYLQVQASPPEPRETVATNLRCFDQDSITRQIRDEKQSAHVVELSGPSGIGKTHVLLAVQREEDRERANKPDEEWGHWKYVYVSGGGSFEQIITKFIKELDPEHRVSDPSTSSLSQDLASCLFELSEEGAKRVRVLFILDDADEISDETLLQLADNDGPVGGSVRDRLHDAVMTLRLIVVLRQPRFARIRVERPDIRVHPLQMDALDLDSVRDMVHQRIPRGRRAEKIIDEMGESIYEITGGHPGAIELILSTPARELFTLLPKEYYNRLRPIVLKIVHRDIIPNLKLREYLLLNILSIFRRLHVGIIWELLEIRLLPSNLLGSPASSERAVRRWLDELVASSALIRRDYKNALFPFGVHPVLQRVLPLSLAAQNPKYLRQLHRLAHQIYHRGLSARDAEEINLILSFPQRPFYTMEALYHYTQSLLIETQEPDAPSNAAEELVALAQEYWQLFGESYQAVPPGLGRDDFALRDQWMQDEELRKLVGRLPGGDAAAVRIRELFEQGIREVTLATARPKEV